MSTTLIDMVARHEGFRATVYCDACGRRVVRVHGQGGTWGCGNCCSGGNLTVGHGQRVDGAGITPDQAASMMAQRLQDDFGELVKHIWFNALDPARKNAILDMAYTMGVAGVLEFKDMIAAIERKDWGGAVHAIIDSKWGNENVHRAAEDAQILLTGQMT